MSRLRSAIARLGLLAILLAGTRASLFAAACSSTGSGNWNNSAIWSCGSSPGPNDSATIAAGNAITVNISTTVGSLSFTGGATLNKVTLLSTVTMTVNGDVTITQPTTTGVSNGWFINAGSATVNGLISFAGTATQNRTSTVTITSGMLTVSTITFAGSTAANKLIVMSGGAATLNVSMAISGNANATLTGGTLGSVVNYNGSSAAQTIAIFGAGSYNNLYINNTSALGATLGAAITATNVTGDLRVQSGTFKNGGFAIAGNAGKTFQVADGASFEMSGASAFPTAFGTFNFTSASRVRYLQTTNPLTISAQTYGHLDLMPAATATQNFPAGMISVLGDLTIGNGTNNGTASFNANATTLTVSGNLFIAASATFTANSTRPLITLGNWNNNGTFIANGSSICFAGNGAQNISNNGKSFATVISSNTSAAGLTFSSSFTATRFFVNTNDLGAAAAVYFAANSTFTISTFTIAGTSSFPVVLGSTVTGTYWYLNNTSSHSVTYTSPQDSNASPSVRRILDNPPGTDLGHNVNWAVGLNPPTNPQFTGATPTSLTGSWTASNPTGDSYTLQVSTDFNFNGTITSSNTAGTSATTTATLSINTTYYGRVNSIINGSSSAWTSFVATATLANIPATAVSTWTAVNFTSITVTWLANSNPATVTNYSVDLSTVSGFGSGQISSSSTYNLNATFTGLVPGATYYARVKAINFSGISTSYLVLGSTITQLQSAPTNPQYTSVQTSSLSGSWTDSMPVGDSYNFLVSTDSNFNGTITSSNTAATSATITSLFANTTYYAQVNSIINGSSSAWTSFGATATLANIPASAASTWTAVNVTSITVTWLANSNPSAVTLYTVDLSSDSSFTSGQIFSSSTYNLNAVINNLDTNVIYFGRVKAINFSGISTNYLSLGSTKTVSSPIPKNLAYTAATATSLSASWSASTPPGDTYTFQVSTDSSFGGTLTSSTTANLFATTPATLTPNTTYYGRANATVSGNTGSWSLTITTATLANTPASASSTWTAVNITSITVNWQANSNPASVTNYSVDLSTVNGFGSGQTINAITTNLNTTYTGLVPGATYYSRVKAINAFNISTAYLTLGSATTQVQSAPTNPQYTSAQTTSLSASWTDSVPVGDSYNLQVSTDLNFNGTIVSSNTTTTSATTAATLSVNTTYYARVDSIINGSSSAWTSFGATATLANAPSTVASTWTAVFLSSLTMNWAANGNPALTLYEADISDAIDFSSNLQSSFTYNTYATFLSLTPVTTYYGRVLAINQSGIDSAYFTAGSTITRSPTTCNASATGLWSSAASWTNCTGPGGLPAPTDAIIVNSGVVITLNIDATVAGITIAAPAANNGINHTTNTLTVNGTVTLNQPSGAGIRSFWNINGGTATVSGLITFAGTTNSATRISSMTITSGTLNALGGITMVAANTASKVIDMSRGAGSLNLQGALTVPANSGTLLTAGTPAPGSSFNYNDDTNAQTINFFPAGAYANLYVNNISASGATLGAAISATNVTGDVRVQSGTLKNGGLGIVGNAAKTFQVSNGATFEMSGASAFPTTFGTFTFGSTSRVRYLQTTNPLTITAQTYGHLDLMPAGTATQNFPASVFSILGDLTIGNGTNNATASFNANATTLTVSGDLFIAANATFTANSTRPLIALGDWNNNGTFIANGSSVCFAGTGGQNISNNGKSFFTLISSNTSPSGLTFSSSFTASKFFINTAGLGSAATVYFASNSTFTISTFTITGTSTNPVVLRSTITGTQSYLNITSSYSITAVDVKDSNATPGMLLQTYPPSVDSGNNIEWDFGPPSAVSDFVATPSTSGLTINLAWTAPGEDSLNGTITNSTFTIQYTTDTAFASGNSWSATAAAPSYVYRVNIATSNVSPNTLRGTSITGLISGGTYYLRLWTTDDNGNISAISNGATNYAANLVESIVLSTDTLNFGALAAGTTSVYTASITVTNAGNLSCNFQLALIEPSVWTATTSAAGLDTYRLTAVFRDATPVSADFDSTNDVILTSTSTASATVYARDADGNSQKGFSVAPSQQRALWFRIEMPAISSTTNDQMIRIKAYSSQ